MSRLAAFLYLASGVWAQSYHPNSTYANSSTTNPCLKRSVIVYTSETSIYIVTDLGSTGFPTSPTICANASTSIIHETTTVYGLKSTLINAPPATTVTIYQSSLPIAGQTTADNGFEDGSEAPFNYSASGMVNAEVATAGPLQPHTGNSYLLITFGQSTSSFVKRQTAQPSIYNVTQIFSAAAGTAHRLSAFAAFAPNGDVSPDCTITICAETGCSDSAAVTTSYSSFSYTYNAESSNVNAVATFVIQCTRSAYVALDDISVAFTSTSGPQGTVTRTITEFITQSQSVSREIGPFTTTQIFTTTTSINGSSIVLTTTVPTIVWATVTQSISRPQATEVQPETQLIPITTTQTLTTTTFISESNVVLTTAIPTTIWATRTQPYAQTQAVEFQTRTEIVPFTTTEIRTTTALISGSSIVLTTTLPTVIWSTVTETVAQPAQTPLLPFTTTRTLTTTTSISGSNIILTTTVPTVIWSTLIESFLQPPSTIFRTLTQVVSFTTFQTLTSTVIWSGSEVTLTTTVPTVFYSTIRETISQPAVTELQTFTQILQVTTSEIVERITTISGSEITITTEVPTIVFSTIENVHTFVITESLTLPQATFTLPAETSYISVTLVPSTLTTTISVTPPPLTETLTMTLPQATFTPPAETLQLTEMLPQETTVQIITEIETFTLPMQTLQLTETLPQATTTHITTEVETFTPPAITEVQIVSLTLTLTPATETQRITETLPAETSILPPETAFATVTLPAQTVTSTLPRATATATITLPTQTVTTASAAFQLALATTTVSCAGGILAVSGRAYCTDKDVYYAIQPFTGAGTTGTPNVPACAAKCTSPCQYWAHYSYPGAPTSSWYCMRGTAVAGIYSGYPPAQSFAGGSFAANIQ